jgi:hypothetical protein
VRHNVGHLVRWSFALEVPQSLMGFGADDGVEPRAQLVRLAQTTEAGGHYAEGVLDTVGGRVAIAEHSDAEVVQPVGVAVIDLGERPTVTVGRRDGEFGVTAAGPDATPVSQCGGDGVLLQVDQVALVSA